MKIVLSLILVFYVQVSLASTCSDEFSDFAFLRNEIVQANLLDKQSGRSLARVSNEIENRAFAIDSTKIVGSHIVSLGSGADVYLPLFLFPNARYFHLVDGLGAWGNGPGDVIYEIEQRLQSISSNAVVKRLDAQGAWTKIEGLLNGPLIWKVRWQREKGIEEEKIFFLHQLNFENSNTVDVLKSYFKHPIYAAKFEGLVITGVGASFATRDALLSLMSNNGMMFTEMNYVNDMNETSSPDDLAILELLRAKYSISNLGKNLQASYFMFSPETFLVLKKAF